MELHIRDVSKTYSNGVQALKDVTLTIPAGMYGLLGHVFVSEEGARRDAQQRLPYAHLKVRPPLAQVLAGPDYTLDDTHVRNQLRLFDF